MANGNPSDHDLLIGLDERVRQIQALILEDRARLAMLETWKHSELIRCPFWPERGNNGNTIVQRIDTLEDEVADTKAFLRGLWRGFLGFGALNVLVIVISFWEKIARLLSGGLP